MSGRYLSMSAWLSVMSGLASGGTSEKYGVFFDSTSNSARAFLSNSGLVSRSMSDAAKTLAPATWPLCEIELVGNTAACHSCAAKPGMVDGLFTLPAGTTQEISPLSLEDAL